jgi:hypothetical protein
MEVILIVGSDSDIAIFLFDLFAKYSRIDSRSVAHPHLHGRERVAFHSSE